MSFNVHGIVYVSEQDAPSDPLEKEGAEKRNSRCAPKLTAGTSEIPFGAIISSQGRAGIHCGQGKNAQKYRREYKCKSQMVERIPARRSGRNVYIPSVVVEEVLRGKPSLRSYTCTYFLANSW